MSNCYTSSCRWRPPGECVYYSGPFIEGYNITNGDNLNTVVQKITNYFNNSNLTETPNAKSDTNSVAITLSGVLNRTIQASVRLDPAGDNRLTVGTEGLYVPPVEFEATFDPENEELTVIIDGNSSVVEIPQTAYTVNNGLIASTPTNFQLGAPTIGGAPLIHDTFIDATNSFALNVIGNFTYTLRATTVGNRAVLGEASGAGTGVTGTAASAFAGVGVFGEANNASGTGVHGTSSAGTGVLGSSITGMGGTFRVDAASTNTSVGVLKVSRTSHGTPASGIGGYILFDIEYTAGFADEAARVGAVWTDPANRTSNLEFTTKLGNAVNKRMTIHSTGDTELHGGGLIMTDTGDASRRRITVVNGVLTVSAPL